MLVVFFSFWSAQNDQLSLEQSTKYACLYLTWVILLDPCPICSLINPIQLHSKLRGNWLGWDGMGCVKSKIKFNSIPTCRGLLSREFPDGSTWRHWTGIPALIASKLYFIHHILFHSLLWGTSQTSQPDVSVWHYGNSKQKNRLTRLRVGPVVARLFPGRGCWCSPR